MALQPRQQQRAVYTIAEEPLLSLQTDDQRVRALQDRLRLYAETMTRSNTKVEEQEAHIQDYKMKIFEGVCRHHHQCRAIKSLETELERVKTENALLMRALAEQCNTLAEHFNQDYTEISVE